MRRISYGKHIKAESEGSNAKSPSVTLSARRADGRLTLGSVTLSDRRRDRRVTLGAIEMPKRTFNFVYNCFVFMSMLWQSHTTTTTNGDYQHEEVIHILKLSCNNRDNYVPSPVWLLVRAGGLSLQNKAVRL